MKMFVRLDQYRANAPFTRAADWRIATGMA